MFRIHSSIRARTSRGRGLAGADVAEEVVERTGGMFETGLTLPYWSRAKAT